MRNSDIRIRVKNEGGKLKVVDTTLYKQVVSAMDPKRKYCMRIFLDTKERTVSDPLRRYYFGVVLEAISLHTGHSALMLHDHFKRMLLGVDVDEYGIQVVRSVFSNESKMPVYQKQQFIEQVRKWAAEFLEVYIPSPETVRG